MATLKQNKSDTVPVFLPERGDARNDAGRAFRVSGPLVDAGKADPVKEVSQGTKARDDAGRKSDGQSSHYFHGGNKSVLLESTMPTESKTLTAARVRKETALSQLRELQLAEREGQLLDAGQVQELWAAQLVAIRDAVLQIPSKVARHFADPRHAEAIVRRECEAALRALSNGG